MTAIGAASPALASLFAARSTFPSAATATTATVLAGALAGLPTSGAALGSGPIHSSSTGVDVSNSGDHAVADACKAMGDAGITPAVLMMTVARLVPDDALRKQLQAVAQRASSSLPPLVPPSSTSSTHAGASDPAHTSASTRRSPVQHLADCRAAVTKIGKAKADAVTFSAEAAMRRRTKRAGAEAAFNIAIDTARKQLEHDIQQLAAYVKHEDAVDAAYLAADAATTAKYEKELAEANAAVAAADAAAAAAGDASTLRPAASLSCPFPVDAPLPSESDDSEDLMSFGEDGSDDGEDNVGTISVDYVCPPSCTAALNTEDLTAAAAARTVLCHWFAQPTAVPLTFGQLGMPIPTVQTLVGETAWTRDFDATATPQADDTVPRPLGGVLLDALGRLQFDASMSMAPPGQAVAAIKAAAARAAAPRRSTGVIKARGKRGGATKVCNK